MLPAWVCIWLGDRDMQCVWLLYGNKKHWILYWLVFSVFHPTVADNIQTIGCVIIDDLCDHYYSICRIIQQQKHFCFLWIQDVADMDILGRLSASCRCWLRKVLEPNNTNLVKCDITTPLTCGWRVASEYTDISIMYIFWGAHDSHFTIQERIARIMTFPSTYKWTHTRSLVTGNTSRTAWHHVMRGLPHSQHSRQLAFERFELVLQNSWW